jgi:hypothetical protein
VCGLVGDLADISPDAGASPAGALAGTGLAGTGLGPTRLAFAAARAA